MNLSRKLKWLAAHAVVAACVLGLASTAGATSLTIDPSATPAILTPGQDFSVIVGLDDVGSVLGYNLAISYDPSELEFLQVVQLATSEPVATVRVPVAFTQDPTADLTGGALAVGAVLSATELRVDLGANTPSTLPAGLFRIDFRATAGLVLDGEADVLVGVLGQGQGVTDANGGVVLLEDPGAVFLEVAAETSTVPEPAMAMPALGALALLLGGLRRRA